MMRPRRPTRLRHRRRTIPFVAALASALTVIALVPASAFEVIGKWEFNELRFRFNPNFPAGEEDLQEQIVRCAAAVWEEQTAAPFTFRYLGRTAIAELDRTDGVNAVFFADVDGDGALASTALIVERTTDTVRSFDMIFYGSTLDKDIDWTTASTPPPGTHDIGGVATHELGHGAGLDHSAVPASTMFEATAGSGIHLRTLDPDDMAGLEFLYGAEPGHEGAEIRITSLDPSGGPGQGGNEVIVRGANFTYSIDTRVFVDGLAVDRSDWEVVACDEIRIASMPPGPEGRVDLTVLNSLGETTLAAAYRYGDPAPLITGIDPSESGIEGGVEVTVNGHAFTENAVVEIDGRPLEDQVFVDAETIIGMVPSGEVGGLVDVTLRQEGDVSTLSEAFFYNAYRIVIGQSTAAPGETSVPVPVFSSSPDPLQSLSFVIDYDPAAIALDSVSTAPSEAITGEAPGFAQAKVDSETGLATIGVVFRLSGEPDLPAGDGLHFADLLFSVADDAAETEHSITLLERGGSPEIITLVNPSVGGTSEVAPVLEGGSLTVAVATDRFIRGDSNGDADVNVADAVFSLNRLFGDGIPPPCAKAADANDDGDFNIADPIRVLNFLFVDAIALPAPYPNAGNDPTPDELTCEKPLP